MFHIFQFLGGRELAATSQVCKEFYFAAFLAAAKHFYEYFGAHHRPSLRRMRLFRLVDKVHEQTEANHRDLIMWSCLRGYVKMIQRLLKVGSASLIETKQPSSGATPLILACEHNQFAAAQELLKQVKSIYYVHQGFVFTLCRELIWRKQHRMGCRRCTSLRSSVFHLWSSYYLTTMHAHAILLPQKAKLRTSWFIDAQWVQSAERPELAGSAAPYPPE